MPKMVLICLLLACGCISESEEEVEEFSAWRCGIVDYKVPDTLFKCFVLPQGVGCEMCQDPLEFYSAEEIEAHPSLGDIPLIAHTYPSKEVCEENCPDLFFEAEYNWDTNTVDTLATYPMACFGYADTTCVRVED